MQYELRSVYICPGHKQDVCGGQGKHLRKAEGVGWELEWGTTCE